MENFLENCTWLRQKSEKIFFFFLWGQPEQSIGPYVKIAVNLDQSLYAENFEVSIDSKFMENIKNFSTWIFLKIFTFSKN